MTDFIMPTSPSDLKKIEDAVKEASNSKLRVEAERDFMKDLKKKMKEELGMPPKLFSKLANTYHNQNYSTVVTETESFVETYEKVFGA